MGTVLSEQARLLFPHHLKNTRIRQRILNKISKMVCVPCIVIPVLLYIWHRFLQPIFLRFYNPWAKVTADEEPLADGGGGAGEAHPGAKVGGSCPFGSNKDKENESLKKTE